MFRKLFVFGALVAGAAGSVVVGGPAHAQSRDDQNCDSFASQAAAQQHLRNDPSDPDRLDEDNNGLACENHPYPSGTPTDTVAVTRTNTTPPTTATTAQVTTTTTSVTGTGEVAETGPRDYVGLLTLAGVIAVAVGVAMRGQRAEGAHWVND